MDQDKAQKLKELEIKYQARLRKLQEKSLKITSDYLKKADEYKAGQILKQFKKLYGSNN